MRGQYRQANRRFEGVFPPKLPNVELTLEGSFTPLLSSYLLTTYPNTPHELGEAADEAREVEFRGWDDGGFRAHLSMVLGALLGLSPAMVAVTTTIIAHASKNQGKRR